MFTEKPGDTILHSRYILFSWCSTLCSLGFEVFLVGFTSSFQLFEITRNSNQKLVFIINHIKVCQLRMIQDISFHAVAKRCLSFQQFSIFDIGFGIDIKFDQSIFMYRNHVIETKHTIFSTVEFKNMFARFDVYMIRFRRFHGYEIFITTKAEYNTYIRTPSAFVVLDFRVTTVKKTNIMITDSVNAQTLHSVPLLLSIRNGETGLAYLAIFQSLLAARDFRFFQSQLTVWANRFFEVQLFGMDSPLKAVIDGQTIISH